MMTLRVRCRLAFSSPTSTARQRALHTQRPHLSASFSCLRDILATMSTTSRACRARGV